MGYYDIFFLFENEGIKERSFIEGGHLIMREGFSVCPFCIRSFGKARINEEGKLTCPACEALLDLLKKE